MRNAMVLATVVLYTVSAVQYVRLTWRRRIEPVPATWTLMLIVFSLSCWMYWKSPNHSFAGNIGNIAGWVNVVLIFTGIMTRQVCDRTLGVAFNSFQKKCLVAGAVIVLFWVLTDQSKLAYILTQVLALVAYLPLVKKLRKAQKNTEWLPLWIAALFACVSAIYPAVVFRDPLAWIYLARAIPSTIIVIVLVLRLKRKEKLHLVQAPT